MTARVTDPQTSHDACKKMSREVIDKIIEQLSVSMHGDTAQGIAHKTGIRLNTVSTTLSAIEKQGIIVKTGYNKKRIKQLKYDRTKPHRFSTIYTLPNMLEKVQQSLHMQEAMENELSSFKIKKAEKHVTVEKDMWFIVSKDYVNFGFDDWEIDTSIYENKEKAEDQAKYYNEMYGIPTKVFKRTIKVKVND